MEEKQGGREKKARLPRYRSIDTAVSCAAYLTLLGQVRYQGELPKKKKHVRFPNHAEDGGEGIGKRGKARKERRVALLSWMNGGQKSRQGDGRTL